MKEQELQYTGFWWRVFASIIDSILILFLLYPILIFVLDDPWGTSTAGLLLQLLLPALAFIGFWQARSTTPGKMAIGAIIVDANTGGKPSTRQWIIRYLGYYVAIIPLLLGLIWVGLDPRKQGWHDKLAGTIVIFKK
jgi:uncharacterized RDD family membrane protein YckC